WLVKLATSNVYDNALDAICQYYIAEGLASTGLRIIRLGPASDVEERFVRDILSERDWTSEEDGYGMDPSRIILSSRASVVNKVNALYMNEASNVDQITYNAIDVVATATVADTQRIEKETGLYTKLVLWREAQVIVTSNVDPRMGIVNGTQGWVLETEEHHVTIRIKDGRRVRVMRETRHTTKGGQSRTQFPLQLA
ncbi:hypothetical protein BGZ58_005083, partial [Dissophora ornata]